jgi:glycosyltransferase involved in cell wall biosynthesis
MPLAIQRKPILEMVINFPRVETVQRFLRSFSRALPAIRPSAQSSKRKSMGRIAAVIPAFNEARTIRDVTERTLRQVPFVVVVDDGSSDGTSAALAGLPVTLLTNEENRGKAVSLAKGAEYALAQGAHAILTLDGDGQHRPEDIPRLVAAHDRDPRAVVIGSRLHDRDRIPRDRYLANRFANFWIAWAAGQPIADSQSGFRIYPAALLREVRPWANRAAGFVFESEILIEAGRQGVRLINVPISAIYPARARRSHFRPVLDIAQIARMVAWKLLSRGLYLSGLVRSLRRSPRDEVDDGAEERGEAR